MRVVNVLFDDRFGGPHRRILDVARGLAPHGVETVMCIPQGTGNAVALAQQAGLEVRTVALAAVPPLRRPDLVAAWLVSLRRDVRCMMGLLQAEKTTIVHVNGAFFLAPALAARRCRLPLVWHINDTVVPRPLARLLGVVVRRCADRIVVSARAVAQHYGIPIGQAQVFYPPVSTGRPAGVAARPADPAGPVRVGLVANWVPIKGVDDFVRAGAKVHSAAGDRLRLVFAGARLQRQAEYAARIDNLIDGLGLRPLVVDEGFVDDVPALLGGLDVLVLSSRSEAAPIVVLEAMAAGCPVVATDVGGVRELLLADPTRPAGVVVPPREPVPLGDAVIALLRDPDTARRLGANGRAIAAERFSLEAAVNAHLAVYRSLAGGDGVG